VVDGEVQVSCGGDDGWSPSIMADGVPGLLGQEEAVRAFRALLADPQFAEELRLTHTFPDDPADTDWRVLTGDESTVVLGLGPWTESGPRRTSPSPRWLWNARTASGPGAAWARAG
jgi:hypothetical protein